jgi:hypothetical protein
MKQLAKYSTNIYKLTSLFGKNLKEKSIENTLKLGLTIFTKDILPEIQHYTQSQQNTDGGFKDRCGNSDIYYSLFGYWLCNALGLEQPVKNLQQYIRKQASKNNHKPIDLLCLAILFKEMIGTNKTLENKVRQTIFQSNDNQIAYNQFLGVACFYYLGDIRAIINLSKRQNDTLATHEKPSTVLAAELVLAKLFSKKLLVLEKAIVNRIQPNGGIKASKIAPIPDLLSTSVALFALGFIDSNLSIIKPGCLDYITNLYKAGGFVATDIDTQPDIEYTFYGILGLGALTNAQYEN